MKKILLLLVLIPTFVFASDEFTVTGELQEDVNGSSIVVSDNVEVKNTINGIGLLLGNNVTLEGTLDYGLIAGNNVNLSGTIDNDVAILGNVINFEDDFVGLRDVFIFGNSITIKGHITRNLYVSAETVVIDNAIIDGNVNITATNIEIKGTNIIDLSYNEDASINIVNSDITNTTLKEIEEISFLDTLLSHLISYVNMLVVFVILALLIPKLFEKINNKEVNLFKLVSFMGIGAISLILLLMASMMLITMPIGIYAGFILLALYLGIMFIANIFSGYLIGYLIMKKLNKNINPLIVGLVGISIIYLLMLIPVIGGIVSLLSILISFGLIINLFKKEN